MARCTSADPKKRLQQNYKVRTEDVKKVKAINQMEDSQLIEEIRPKTQQGPRNHRNRGYDSSAMQKTLVMPRGASLSNESREENLFSSQHFT
jgi:hypothetical protein